MFNQKTFLMNVETHISQINDDLRMFYYRHKRYLVPPKFPILEDGKIYLNLGCGYTNHPKFINIDMMSTPSIHYRRPIDNLSIFKAKSVDLIYASHCLEHFPFAKVPTVLQEWCRVLKPDGILRISVPDFDLLLKIYCENGNNLDGITGALMGGQNDKYDFHMSVFNKLRLEQMLLEAGFREVRLWQPVSCELTTFDDWSNRKVFVNNIEYTLSLNIEAVK